MSLKDRFLSFMLGDAYKENLKSLDFRLRNVTTTDAIKSWLNGIMIIEDKKSLDSDSFPVMYE